MPSDSSELNGIAEPSRLHDRVVRYADLVPCTNAFIDTRTPGSDRKENFTIIGPGVAESRDQHVHISEPHGFNIGGARQPPHCVNSQHSHDTAETFVVHTGRWRFTFGEDGTDAAVEAGPGDLVSFPTRTFRGFENIGEEVGFLWSVLGGDDPGRVLWAPAVFDLASKYGLVLLEDGSLIDTAAGQSIPAEARPMPRTSPQQVAALQTMDQAAAERLIVRLGDSIERDVPAAGVARARLIGDGGFFPWDHGFTLDRIELSADTAYAMDAPVHPHVLFVHAGTVELSVDGAAISLHAGDTVTIPSKADRRIAAAGPAILFSVERAG